MINKKILFIQTIGHFCVDAACAAVVVSGTQYKTQIIAFFVLYNFLAFCLQPLAGIALDKILKLQPSHYIISSFILLLFGFIPQTTILFRVILVGIGNCLFHTGAGTVILLTSHKRMAPLGIFVSSGALGLLCGTVFADSLICHITLVVSLLTLILLNLNANKAIKIQTSESSYWLITILLCLCVAIRSFIGFAPLTQFEKTPFIILLITLGVFLGKFFGGILCDRWGIRRIIIISTIFVMATFLFSFQNPFLWTLIQTIANLSMPVTLYLIYRSLPALPAFSFGLAASLLPIGYLGTILLSETNIPPACFLILFILNLYVILYTERKLT